MFAAVVLAVGWTWRPGQPYLPDPRATIEVTSFTCPVQPAPPPGPPPSRLERVADAVLLHSDDSWKAMRAALDHFEYRREQPVYATIFKLCIKFQYPPSSLLVLDAMRSAFGPFAVSNGVLNALSIGFLALLLAVISKIYGLAFPKGTRLGALDRVVPVLFGLISYPVLKSFQLGQIQTWLNSLFAIGVLLYMKERPTAAGVVLGVIATIKPQLALLLPWAAVRRDWAFVRGMAATGAIVLVISLLRYGIQPHLDYVAVLGEISRHGESYFANQSLNGLLLRAFRLGANIFFEKNQFAPYHPAVRLGTMASSLLLIGFAVFWRPSWLAHNRSSTPNVKAVGLCLAALCFTIGSPIAWEHHYGIVPVLFAVAIVALETREGYDRRLWIALGVAWIFTAVRFAGTMALASTDLNFVQSSMYFGALVLLAVLHVLRRPIGVATAEVPLAMETEPRRASIDS